MQIFLSKNRFFLSLLMITVFFGCGPADDETPIPIVQPEELQYGTVSGKVTDAKTNNPLHGAVVRLFGLEVKTEVDGVFAFHGIPYEEEQNITVHDPDYQPYTYTFTLNQPRLVLNPVLTPLVDPENELNTFLENFSDLIESLDVENIPVIQALFSESYVASNDPLTNFGIQSGIIPPNHEDVTPTFTNIFEKYAWLRFAFKNKNADITHARKASIELLLDIESENAETGDLRHLEAKCIFEFRREDSDWKIVYWQLLNLNVGF